MLHIDAYSYSHKLNGRRNFVPRELNALARYFELGENGMDLFKVESAKQFREELKARGVGNYAANPATLLNAALWEMAENSKATLTIGETKIEHSLPADLKSVTHVGIYAKATQSEFTRPMRVQRETSP